MINKIFFKQFKIIGVFYFGEKSWDIEFELLAKENCERYFPLCTPYQAV